MCAGTERDPRNNKRLGLLLRSAALGVILLSVLRAAAINRANTAPREVLYSDFVSLLEESRVRSARLESGTSRIYFDLKAAAQAEAAEAAVAGKAAPAAARASSKAAPAQAAATAAAAAQASQPQASASQRAVSSRRFYIKLADKQDLFLLPRILEASVEFSVVKQSFTALLANVLLTAVALWVPLLPLVFILRRLLQGQNGTTPRKKKADPSAPVVTFKDVAGAARQLVTATC